MKGESGLFEGRSRGCYELVCLDSLKLSVLCCGVYFMSFIYVYINRVFKIVRYVCKKDFYFCRNFINLKLYSNV